jgi:hypothetical protein
MVQLKFERRLDRHAIVLLQPLMQIPLVITRTAHRAGRDPGLGGQSTIQRRWGRGFSALIRSSFAQNDGQ